MLCVLFWRTKHGSRSMQLICVGLGVFPRRSPLCSRRRLQSSILHHHLSSSSSSSSSSRVASSCVRWSFRRRVHRRRHRRFGVVAHCGHCSLRCRRFSSSCVFVVLVVVVVVFSASSHQLRTLKAQIHSVSTRENRSVHYATLLYIILEEEGGRVLCQRCLPSLTGRSGSF